MGNSVQSSPLRPEVLADLQNTTAFTADEIRDLYREYRHECAKHKAGERLEMTVEEFKQVYHDIFPQGDSNKFAQHVFRTFDKDNDGHISFREFITTLSVQLKGTTEERLEWAFNLYDVHNNGYITREEATEIITMCHKLGSGHLPKEDKITPKDLTKHIFNRIDTEHNDRIDKKSFITGAKESKTMQLLLLGTMELVAEPYVIRKQRSGSFGRRRSSIKKEDIDALSGRRPSRSSSTKSEFGPSTSTEKHETMRRASSVKNEYLQAAMRGAAMDRRKSTPTVRNEDIELLQDRERSFSVKL